MIDYLFPKNSRKNLLLCECRWAVGGEIIKELTRKSCNAYISDLVIKDIERIKKEQNSAEQVQSAPQTTESSEKTEDDKTIIEYAKAENNDSDECPF